MKKKLLHISGIAGGLNPWTQFQIPRSLRLPKEKQKRVVNRINSLKQTISHIV
jgi:hypothetical protein